LLAERPTAFALSLVAAGLMLLWLMRTSSHVGKLNERAARNLIQARKSRRELEQANRELNRKRARMDTELRIARRIQEGILPNTERFADSERLAVAARYMALDGIGGDYYDFAHPSKNCYGFFIADVSGHGVPAALVTTMTKVAFSNHSRSVGAYPEQVLGAINAEMYNFLGDLDHYLTACYLLVDLDRGIASIASGGHTPALIHRRSTGTLQEWTATSSFFLGVEPDFQYSAQEMRLVDRDRIILYTDGLSEMQNAAREFYGERRFEELLLERADADGEQLVQGLMDDLQKFAGGRTPADDIAVLCIDYFETL
jgi:serine phosphatase RsbU (regulator of sigma subunit)